MSKARIHTNLVGALVQIAGPLNPIFDANPYCPVEYAGKKAEIVNVYLDSEQTPAYTLMVHGNPEHPECELWDTYNFAFKVVAVGWRQNRFG